ncbi:hypothetical protein NDU88_010682 [Pleurodeles waltl]|uniref:Uncharacterized protein n=1 Tax=Pleurodeles waltl TaxID=8319 RepID=A0AAV7QWD6_PLEWA|nr:hypothetical protein NDU88_010682 [Pleurodeles waltl]
MEAWPNAYYRGKRRPESCKPRERGEELSVMARHSQASKYRSTWPAEVEESRVGAGEEKTDVFDTNATVRTLEAATLPGTRESTQRLKRVEIRAV